MAKLIYTATTSLDGYIEDSEGKLDWAEPSDEVHRFINDLERPVGIYLYGRRMYETMAGWETDPSLAATSPVMKDYAEIWQAADKIVFSKTLPEIITTRTRIERNFNPEQLRQLKTNSERNLGMGGSALAGEAFAAGLIDELHLFLSPVMIGAGKPAFSSKAKLNLRLLEEHRFENGTMYLRYQTLP